MKIKTMMLPASLFLMIIAVITLYTQYNKSLKVSVIPESNFTIVIDAGHGTPDGGAVADDGTLEKDLNFMIAKKLKRTLVNKGLHVIMIRKNDNSLSKSKTNNKQEDLNNRVSIVNNSGADLLVSIHMNKFSDSKYYGAQVFYNPSSENNKLLAERIQYQMINTVDKSNTRKIKFDDSIYLLKKSQITSVLVECGFMSNKKELINLKDKKYQQKIANAISSGITDYINSIK